MGGGTNLAVFNVQPGEPIQSLLSLSMVFIIDKLIFDNKQVFNLRGENKIDNSEQSYHRS
ncbi:MAG: hypothetical protein Tsb005_08400 [Gammaproteobacteria bacterium]